MDSYIERINRVIDFIDQHLHEELSLHRLAEIAHFSPYHFHRIFRAIMNEPLNQYIQRIRLERAAMQLTANPRKTISEIALDTGFSGSASFARAFREHFKVSASGWRTGDKDLESKIRKTIRKNREQVRKMNEAVHVSSVYIDSETRNPKWRIHMNTQKNVDVEVRDMPEQTVAYIRHIGPYKADAELFRGLFEKLMRWAAPRDLLRFPETKFMTLYHDDIHVTDESKLRMSVCLTVPADTPVEGEVGKMTIPAGRYAIGHFEIADSTRYEEAWNALYGGWLPESGYQPAEGICYELYLNNPEEHPEHVHIVDICIPVKPL
jgi:AraC family transcriptional regulator